MTVGICTRCKAEAKAVPFYLGKPQPESIAEYDELLCNVCASASAEVDKFTEVLVRYTQNGRMLRVYVNEDKDNPEQAAAVEIRTAGGEVQTTVLNLEDVRMLARTLVVML